MTTARGRTGRSPGRPRPIHGPNTAAGPAAIRLVDVTKHFGEPNAPAVESLDLDIEQGTIMALLGPSGCGKTTTLRMINRLIEPTSGRIEINGDDVTEMPAGELRRGIGYVIQQVGLFPHRTIAANIATVPKMLGWDNDRTDERVTELTQLVGLDPDVLPRYPDELSGGQQQRVGVARALAADPPVLLMDEPFGAVDPIVRTRLQDELLDLQAKVHKTIVLVTHDLDEALRVADTIALMNTGGVLEQVSSPDELMRAPANAFVESFVGEERGLRRLGLSTISSLPQHRGPVVPIEASLEEVEAAAAAESSEWVGFIDGEVFAGWAQLVDARAMAAGGRRPSDVELLVPAAQVSPDDTLRAAMEQIMVSNTSVAVIDRDGTFGGVVTLDDLRASLAGAGT